MSDWVSIVATVALAADEETQFDPSSVTPGVLGFVFTALFALAVIFLGYDLVRRLRRSRYRAEIQEELAAEIVERDAAVRRDDPDAGAPGQPGASDTPGSRA